MDTSCILKVNHNSKSLELLNEKSDQRLKKLEPCFIRGKLVQNQTAFFKETSTVSESLVDYNNHNHYAICQDDMVIQIFEERSFSWGSLKLL